MMNNRGRKWMALLLAAVMLLGILPISAMADDEPEIVEATITPVGEGEYTSEADLSGEGFVSSPVFKSGDMEVEFNRDIDPNDPLHLVLTVTEGETKKFPSNTDETQMVYTLKNVTVSDGENDVVSWTYNEERSLLIFKWKGEKANSFTADITLTPAFPAENDLSGNYVLISQSHTSQSGYDGMLLNVSYDKGDKRSRLAGANITYIDGAPCPEGWPNAVWTFTHVTGDWYTVSSNGQYLKLDISENRQGGLFLTNDPETAQKIKVEPAGNGLYFLTSNGYRVTTQGGYPTNGYAAYYGSSDNEKFRLYPAASMFNSPTVNLSGTWAIENPGKVKTLLTANAHATNGRLKAITYDTYNTLYLTDENVTYWTFEHITRDWYYVSTAGGYLNITSEGVFLGGRTPIQIKSDNGFETIVLTAKVNNKEYALISKSQNVKDGFASTTLNMGNANAKMKLVPASRFYTGVLITFNVNGGNTEMESAIIEAQPGESIVLPDYSGTKGDTRFIGWAKVSDIYVNIRGTNHSYYDVFLPGSEIIVNENMTLYAVYNEQGTDARFGIRLDGTIPDEPGNYNQSGYGGHVSISDAIIDGKWVVDTNGNKPIEGNHIVNNVTANLTKLPSDEQIRTALKKEGNKDYDPETMYVHWYVMKYSGNQWKIDGVLRLREKRSISYNTNVEDRQDNTAVTNMPLGYETTRSSIVTVGAGQDGSIKTPVREGYVFTGWNSEPDGSGTAFITGSTIQLTGNVNLYAQWTKENVRSITITSDWPDGKQGYRGARITMTATLYGFEDVTSYTLQWQYSTDGEAWHDVANAHGITYTYELDETTRYNTWRVIAVDIH